MIDSQISTADMIRLCQRVGTSLRAGLSMRRIWESECQRGKLRHRQAMQHISQRVNEGDTLVSAMRETGYFPKLALSMIEIGELTGRLEMVFHKLGEHYTHQQEMVRMFLRGILWPGIQFGAGVLLIGGLMYAFGVVAGITGSDAIDLLGLGSGVVGMLRFYVLVGGSLTIIFIFVYSMMRGWLGPVPVQIAMRLPVLGPCFQQMAMGRLCWSLGMALDAGLDAVRSVELSIDSTQNPFYRSRTEPVKLAIAEHHCEFHEAFRNADGFPLDFLDQIEAAELSGTLSESLVRMSREYDEEAKRSLATITMLATGLTWMLVTGLLIFMIFKVGMIYFGALYGALKEVGA